MNEEYEELCLKDREVIDYIIYQFRKVDIEFDKRFNLEQENKQLKDNWNKLKEWLEEKLRDSQYELNDIETPEVIQMMNLSKAQVLDNVLDKLQEIEGGMNE